MKFDSKIQNNIIMQKKISKNGKWTDAIKDY